MAPRKKKTTKAKAKNTTPLLTPERIEGATLFAGLAVFGAGLFLLLSIVSADVTREPAALAERCITGLLGAWAAQGLVLTLGHTPALFFGCLVAAWGFHVARMRRLWRSWPKVLGGLIMTVALAALLPSLPGREPFPAGGLLAHRLYPVAHLYLGTVGIWLAAGLALFCGAVLAFGMAVVDLAVFVHQKVAQAMTWSAAASGAAVAEGWNACRPRLAALTVTARDRALVPIRRTESTSTGGRRRSAPAPESEADDTGAGESAYATALEVEAAVVDEMPPPPPPVVEEAPPAAPADNAAVADEYEEAQGVKLSASGEPILDEFTPYGEEPDEEEGPKIRRAPPRPKATLRASPNETLEDYQLPPLHLLQEPEESFGEGKTSLERRAKILEQTLLEFKIEGRVVHIECGPRVTLFEMTLAPGIRLSKVIGLADNITMALKATNVRIIAPIPGKDTIGIEIPNVEKELVTLREVAETVDRKNRREALPICLAKDVSGKPIVADLAKMPHLLIAGATGSGKSVCINSIILSYLMCCTPDEVKMIMVDPKVVELSRFKDIPHLLSPVITDMKKTVGVLEWACVKMDERYEQLSMVGVNNIAKFNALGAEEVEKRVVENYGEDELENFPRQLPYMVIIIDELADLMMVAGKEVEVHITRLAAKSRAVGIHVILATQRPSVDVITGLIKANMPSRIAFQVSSRVDSRTILDQNGAETLLGAGDMLFLPPGVGKLMRAQGVFVSDEELFAIVDFCKAQRKPRYHEDLEGPVIGGKGGSDVEDFDELFVEASRSVLESGRGSVSLLQRKLGIGYGRASRIIDQMAAAAILGPFREGKAREILMTMEEFESAYGNGAGGGRKGGSQEDLPLAGLRDDEREPDDLPWDDED